MKNHAIKKKYLEMGVCHGLTTLYCYYQFLGKENVFFELPKEVLATTSP